MSLPIKDISTFVSKIEIIAKVVRSEAPRSFSGNKPGKVWNITLRDDAGDEIIGKFWNDAVDKFQPILKQGSVYKFTKARVGMANKRYTTCPHPYELTFDFDSSIVEQAEVVISSAAKYNTMEGGIRNVKTSNRVVPFSIDLVGIVVQYSPVETIVLKSGGSQIKRDFYVGDESGHKMKLTMWGVQPSFLSDKFLASKPCVGLRSVVIKEFKGRNGTVQPSDIEHLQEHKVLEWYKKEGNSVNFVSISDDMGSRSSIMDGGANNNINMPGYTSLSAGFDKIRSISDERMSGGPDSTLFFKSIVYPNRFFYQSERDGVKQMSCTYSACDGCSKKIIPGSGCVSCDATGTHTRYMIQTYLADDSGSKFGVRLFHNQAEVVLHPHTADSVMKADEQSLHRIFDWEVTNKPFEMTIKAENRVYNGVPRMNINAVTCAPVDVFAYFDSTFSQVSDKLTSTRKRDTCKVDENQVPSTKASCTETNVEESVVV